jgi:hypothetical protein
MFHFCYTCDPLRAIPVLYIMICDKVAEGVLRKGVFAKLHAFEQNSKLRPKASSRKDSRKGGGTRSGPPLLWEAAAGRLLIYGGWLSA